MEETDSLRTKALFPTPIIFQRDGKLRVSVNAGLKLLEDSYFFEHEAIFAQVAPNPRSVLEQK